MPDEPSRFFDGRVPIVIAIVATTIAGFSLKLYPGPLRFWVNNSLAGVAYVVFWSLVVFLVVPRRAAAAPIALIVLAVTGALEFTQLLSSPLLTDIRATFIGRTLLGTTFTWLDFPYYAAGALIAFGMMMWLGIGARQQGPKRKIT